MTTTTPETPETTETTDVLVTATLVPHAGTAALLRVVSVLHSRRTTVHELTFETGEATRVLARVSLGAADAATLQRSLDRSVEVLHAAVDAEGDPAARADHSTGGRAPALVGHGVGRRGTH
jgi:hypothetical protein